MTMTYSAEQLAQARKLDTSTLFDASGITTAATDIAIRLLVIMMQPVFFRCGVNGAGTKLVITD